MEQAEQKRLPVLPGVESSLAAAGRDVYLQIRQLRAKLEAARAVRAERERELLELKGPCSTCSLHYAHSGPCAPVNHD